MIDERPPVPAAPTLVLALGEALRERVRRLEGRFRREIGSLYPGYLVRFRTLARPEDTSVEALRTLVEPLLAHPLWLALIERGFAPGSEHGPRLDAYVLLSEEDPAGFALLEPLAENLQRACRGRLEPALRLFYVGEDPSPERLGAPAGRVTCFVLGAVKQQGYGIENAREPWETLRLALNALLASRAPQEIEALFSGAENGRLLALGASAIAIARPQMEACVRAGLLERLARACRAAPSAPTPRAPVADLFGLQPALDGPEELWAKRLGQEVTALFPAWANEALAHWGLVVDESRSGHWQVTVQAEGEVHRHLQRILAGEGDEREQAQAALARDLARLAAALRRSLRAHEATVLGRWRELMQRTAGEGEGCLARAGGLADLTAQALEAAHDRVSGQRPDPLWLRHPRGRDTLSLARVLAGRMSPWRADAERARRRLAPPLALVLRAVPGLLLAGAIGADLRPGGWGLGAGLALGGLLGVLAASVQARNYARDVRLGAREAARIYENATLGLLLGVAHDMLQRWQDAVAISLAQVQALDGEMRELEASARRTVEASIWRAGTGIYLERLLSDPIQCMRLAEGVPLQGVLAGAPVQALAAALTGELPARAVSATLAGAIGAQDLVPIEARVEEMLVAGEQLAPERRVEAGRRRRPGGEAFSPTGTMDALHRRALPLWQGDMEGPEHALVILSREAAVAVRGWLDAHRDSVRQLPTLQRDRMTYLRVRRVRRGGIEGIEGTEGTDGTEGNS